MTVPACTAPRCNAGDVTEAGLGFCPPGAKCYQRSGCGQTVYCTSGEQCEGDPACPPGYDQVASCLSGGTPGCMTEVICGVTISCEAQCDGYPSCDPGDTKVASQADCLQDDAVCYPRAACGISIWCTGPGADAGASFPPPPPPAEPPHP